METHSKELIETWQKDPKNWKLGNFYFNKKDKRIFVEKPNPDYGITINCANPKTYLFLLATVAFFGFVIYMIEDK